MKKLTANEIYKRIKYKCGIGALKSALGKNCIEHECLYTKSRPTPINFYFFSKDNEKKINEFLKSRGYPKIKN